MEGLLNGRATSPYHGFAVDAGHGNTSASIDASHVQLFVKLQPDAKVSPVSASLRSLEPVLDIRHKPAFPTLPTFIADEIAKVFEGETASTSHLLEGSPFARGVTTPELSPESRTLLDAKATRSFKSSSNYHLAFSLFAASASPSTWEIEQALEQYIHPLLRRLAHISQFTVNTQVQLYASFSPSISGPHWDDKTKAWRLHRADLGGFVNAAEWPLSPSIGSGPTMNFVLYIPSEATTPLLLAETGETSWLIPQWGGVQILNPSPRQRHNLTTHDLRPILHTFASQLTSLLGLPSTPPSLALQIARLERDRATAFLLSAASTLGALARLSHKLPSIAIPDSVAASVADSLLRLPRAAGALATGHYAPALAQARVADAQAESAFFAPSMLAQVYFPDEHKVAVYVPLLGPMAVPLLIAALKELRRFAKSKSKTA